jgi:hypothetical protein
LISSIVASAAAKGTPEKKGVPMKYTLSTAGFSSDLLMATAMGYPFAMALPNQLRSAW